MSFSRRRFLGYSAGAAAGAVAGRYGGAAFARLTSSFAPLVFPPGGPQTFALSVCRECPGGCGVRVRCIGGRPVKVDGNPLHPVNGGRLCPKGQAMLQSLYHPDRVAGPLRRAGARGSLESFRPASWDEALEEIAVRLSLLRQQGRPEALALLRGPSRGIGARLASRFLAAFGSPNDVVLDRGGEAAAQAVLLTQGVRAEPAYDLASAEYALSFGCDLLEASGSPVHAMRDFGRFRQGERGRRGRLVYLGPRMSPTAAAADEWVPIQPGTEGILALGFAGVIVAEGLQDVEFVAHRMAGFEGVIPGDGTGAAGLRQLLERDFGLERVAQESGVPSNRILRLAREFAAAKPGIAFGPRSGRLLPARLFDHLAVQVLNALAGNLDAPGGLLLPEEVPLAPWPDLAADPIGESGRSRPRLDGVVAGASEMLASDPEGLAGAVLAQEPYRAEVLFLLGADPAFASTTPPQFVAALEQVPLVVSFATIPDDSSLYADWILPAAHALESWNFERGPDGVPYPVASLSRPVLPPLHDARPEGEVFLELARRLGGPVAAALPWPDLPSLLRSESDGLFEARRGAILGTAFDEAWVRLMERAGWWAPGYRSPDELWSRIQETGGWWDPFYDHWHWGRVLQTPSGRFECRAELLAELDQQQRLRGAELGPQRRAAARADATLALQLFEPLALAAGRGAELPFLQEILDAGVEERWRTWVELHPVTAAALGVEDGAPVRVASSHGEIRARAQVTDRVVPGVAALPVGLGRRAGGRWSAGRGANPLQLLSPVRETRSGLPDLGATRVRVLALAATAEEE